jgi:hypothetical protein
MRSFLAWNLLWNCGYLRAVDPTPQTPQRRRTTIRLTKRDLDPLVEDEENDLDEDSESFTDNEGK